MSSAFGPAYADAYDALYADKDYDAECELLQKIFSTAGRPIRSVLDLGCGTGAHATRLAALGYDVVGVDVSEAMLQIARREPEPSRTGRLEFVQGDIRTVRLDREFDAAICMFAVLGYQTSDTDVAAALNTVRRHLAQGGPFVFDVWYGPAVEAIGPSTRSKVVAKGDLVIEREASAVLEPESHVCTVSYRLIERPPGAQSAVVNEVHRMRYFFSDELERFAQGAGLSLGDLMPFPEIAAPLSPATWNVIGIARG